MNWRRRLYEKTNIDGSPLGEQLEKEVAAEGNHSVHIGPMVRSVSNVGEIASSAVPL